MSFIPTSTIMLGRTCPVRFNFGYNWSISLRLDEVDSVVCSLIFREDNNYVRWSDQAPSGMLIAGTVLRKPSKRNATIGILKWIIYKYRCTVAVTIEVFHAFNHDRQLRLRCYNVIVLNNRLICFRKYV